MKQKKLDHLDLVCLEIAKYNKIHNTYYSYGEYTALVREALLVIFGLIHIKDSTFLADVKALFCFHFSYTSFHSQHLI